MLLSQFREYQLTRNEMKLIIGGGTGNPQQPAPCKYCIEDPRFDQLYFNGTNGCYEYHCPDEILPPVGGGSGGDDPSPADPGH